MGAAFPDTVTITGGVPLHGSVRPPGDKSLSHRCLLLAAMAEGRSTLRGLGSGDDVARTRAVIEHLGAVVALDPGRGTVTVDGPGLEHLRPVATDLDCGNSGTTMRLVAGLAAGLDGTTVLTGDGSLRSRPMDRVVEPLRALGADIEAADDGLHAPLRIRGGRLTGRRVECGVASAQVTSALVLAGLQAEGTTEIVEPAPSRDHTERMLRALDVPVERRGDILRVRRGAPRPFSFDVPGDPSSAAFLVVAATLVPGSAIVVEDVDVNPLRIGFVEVLRRMGADIDITERGERLGEPVADIVVRAAPLSGTDIDSDEIPGVIDELPVLAVAAAFAVGTTRIRGAGELRAKESDRIATVSTELARLGAAVEQLPDGLIVGPGELHPGDFVAHGDHRVALAAATGSLGLPGTSTVSGWGATAVSYPGFLDDVARLQVAA